MSNRLGFMKSGTSASAAAKRAVLGASLLILTQGCAFSDLTVRPPSPQEVAYPAKVGRGRELALIMPFADYRPHRERCGMKKNGYGMDTANAICSIPPAHWMANALAQGLTSAGYRVVVNPAAPSASSVRIQGAVLQFFVEPDVGFFTYSPETDISIELVVTSPTGLKAERTFYLKGVETSMVGTEDNFQKSASTATRQTVVTMVNAITSLLDRYPPLVAPASAPAVSMSLLSNQEMGR